MFTCPHCRSALIRQSSEHGIFWSCPACAGRLVGIAPLRNILHRSRINHLWQSAKQEKGWARRECPACRHKMWEIFPEDSEGDPALDICNICHMVWFDPDEFELLPKIQNEPEKEVPIAVQQLGAIAKVELESQRTDNGLSTNTPEGAWKYLPGLLGFPVESETTYTQYVPLATWLLTFSICVLSVMTFFNHPDQWVQQWGFVPADPFRLGGLTLAASFFLHGGFFHLFANSYFLLTFGDQVEDYLRPASFCGLLAVGHLAGLGLHTLYDPHPHVPLIGASCGVSAVLTFYSLKFPHIRLGRFFYFRWLEMPAWVYFAFWTAFQAIGLYTQSKGVSDVSFFGHLGGIIAGFIWWTAYRRR